MRSRLAALLLLAMLSMMSLLIRPTSAPAILDIGSLPSGMDPVPEPKPEPYGILDIGPPPKGETAEAYRQRQITGQTHFITLSQVWWRVKTFPTISSRPPLNHRVWLAENLRVTAEEGNRRLRFTFEAGTRAEQAAVINAFLHNSLFWQKQTLKSGEEWLRRNEKNIHGIETRIKRSHDPRKIAFYRKAINDLRSISIPELRAELARQQVVIRWAK